MFIVSKCEWYSVCKYCINACVLANVIRFCLWLLINIKSQHVDYIYLVLPLLVNIDQWFVCYNTEACSPVISHGGNMQICKYAEKQFYKCTLHKCTVAMLIYTRIIFSFNCAVILISVQTNANGEIWSWMIFARIAHMFSARILHSFHTGKISNLLMREAFTTYVVNVDFGIYYFVMFLMETFTHYWRSDISHFIHNHTAASQNLELTVRASMRDSERLVF